MTNVRKLVSGSPSEMVVSYLTIGMPEHSKVKYGLVSNQYTYKATGGSVTYLKVSSEGIGSANSKISHF